MKRNVVLEAQILKAIEILGEGTDQEIINEIKDQFQVEIDEYEFMRNLRRWLAKKCITITKVKGEAMYKFRDPPPWFKSLQTYQMKGITAKNAEVIIAKLEAITDAEKTTIGKGVLIGTYNGGHGLENLKNPFECTFITLDPVAGGDNGKEERLLVFPRRDGKPYIRGNIVNATLRDNARVIDITENFMRQYVSVSDSEPLDVETEIAHGIKVAEGLADYETLPIGTKFTVKIRFPFKGSCIKSIGDFKKFCGILEDTPLKGLGSYSKHFGGRIKLISITDPNDTA